MAKHFVTGVDRKKLAKFVVTGVDNHREGVNTHFTKKNIPKKLVKFVVTGVDRAGVGAQLSRRASLSTALRPCPFYQS